MGSGHLARCTVQNLSANMVPAVIVLYLVASLGFCQAQRIPLSGDSLPNSIGGFDTIRTGDSGIPVADDSILGNHHLHSHAPTDFTNNMQPVTTEAGNTIDAFGNVVQGNVGPDVPGNIVPDAVTDFVRAIQPGPTGMPIIVSGVNDPASVQNFVPGNFRQVAMQNTFPGNVGMTTQNTIHGNIGPVAMQNPIPRNAGMTMQTSIPGNIGSVAMQNAMPGNVGMTMQNSIHGNIGPVAMQNAMPGNGWTMQNPMPGNIGAVAMQNAISGNVGMTMQNSIPGNIGPVAMQNAMPGNIGPVAMQNAMPGNIGTVAMQNAITRNVGLTMQSSIPGNIGPVAMQNAMSGNVGLTMQNIPINVQNNNRRIVVIPDNVRRTVQNVIPGNFGTTNVQNIATNNIRPAVMQNMFSRNVGLSAMTNMPRNVMPNTVPTNVGSVFPGNMPNVQLREANIGGNGFVRLLPFPPAIAQIPASPRVPVPDNQSARSQLNSLQVTSAQGQVLSNSLSTPVMTATNSIEGRFSAGVDVNDPRIRTQSADVASRTFDAPNNIDGTAFGSSLLQNIGFGGLGDTMIPFTQTFGPQVQDIGFMQNQAFDAGLSGSLNFGPAFNFPGNDMLFNQAPIDFGPAGGFVNSFQQPTLFPSVFPDSAPMGFPPLDPFGSSFISGSPFSLPIGNGFLPFP